MPQEVQMSEVEEPVIDHSQGNESTDPAINESLVDAGSLDTSTSDTVEELTASEDSSTTKIEEDNSKDSLSFEPDYTYKVRDQEHTLDDWAQPLIKDKETLGKFKDLYTRGHGLELAKQERDEYKNKYTSLEDSLNTVNGIIGKYYNDPSNTELAASTAREFIESLGLPKDMFMQYAINELKYQQLPSEERASVDSQRQQQQQYQMMLQQTENLQQQNQQIKTDYYLSTLDAGLAEPSTALAAQEYDSRMGTPGAFKNFVIQRGIFHEKTTGQIKSPQECLEEAKSMLGITPQGTAPQVGQAGAPATQTPQQPQTLTAQQMEVQRQKPTLPNISGQGGLSPVKKGYSSIEQIRAKYNEVSAGV